MTCYFRPAEAARIAKDLSRAVPEQTFTPAQHPAKGEGYSYINIYTAAGKFIRTL